VALAGDAGMDQDLVARAQHGDQGAFEALTIADQARLFKVAHGILRDRQLAEDAIQQAFLDIWRNLPRLRDVVKYEAWSYRLLVRACYAEARRKPRWVVDDEILQTTVMKAPDAYHEVIDRDVLERGFGRLSLDHRAVIVLRYLLDMTPDEIADILDIPRKTVYSRLDRAVQVMRGAIEADSRTTATTHGHQEVIR
jgi:RNA polymerase sigma-70 factor (ECF subfamily)